MSAHMKLVPLTAALMLAFAASAQAQSHHAHHDDAGTAPQTDAAPAHAHAGHGAHQGHGQTHAATSTHGQAADHAGMDRSGMDHTGADHSGADHTGMDHTGMDHAGMDHGLMGHGPGAPAAESRPPADHVPPPPPTLDIGQLTHAQMDAVMGMNDSGRFGRFTLDRLEYVQGGATAWSVQAWYGGDSNRLHFRSEGQRKDGKLEHADAELLWSHAIAPFWDSQIGLRRDFGEGPDRTWAAFGVQGLAPYWFEVAATAYVGEQGRTALRVEADYDLLLTQRLVLQPRFELNAYGKDDPARRIGSGLSDAEAGLRLRYEIRREFAPYVGVEWSRSFGRTADFARADGHDVTDVRWVAGVRIWF